MMSSNVLCLTMCVVAAGALFSETKLSPSETPLWTEEIQHDLSNYAGVSFLDDEKLLAYEVEHTSQLSSRESPEISSAYRLHVSLLDAGSGQLILARDWGTRHYDTELQVTRGGVLVKTGSGGIMKLYSPDLTQGRDLPVALEPNGSYFTSVSASGKTIAISHYFQKDQKYISHIDVLDAKSLKVLRSWDQCPPIFHFSMSDKRFATSHDGVVAITEFGSGRSKPVAVLGVLKQGCAAGIAGPHVVSDELMVLRGCKEVILLTAIGESSSLDAFNGHGSTAAPGTPCRPYNAAISGKVAIASGGRFVALTLPALKIKKPLFAEWRTCLDGLQIAVYDLALKRRILTVTVDALPKNDYDFALSPDGSQLAILNDRRVSVYSVPVRSVDHIDTLNPQDGMLRVQVPVSTTNPEQQLPRPQP